MNPVELKRGRSFKGLAQYLTHDAARVEGQHPATAQRVGWTQSFNLNDADPNRAWRYMAATARSADALKESAGEVKTGAKNTKPVYHYTLTWSETDQVNDELQRKAVAESLQTLGFENHQALAVQHKDGKPHVHVMVNLIDPENGTTPKLSYTRKKLRKWADKFEEKHGLELTEGSRINAEKRRGGEKVDARRKPRNVYEQQKSEDQSPRMAWLRTAANQNASTLMRENRELKNRHTSAYEAVESVYQSRRSALKADREDAVQGAISAVKEAYKSRWAKTFKESREKLQQFDQAERGAVSKLFNAGRTFLQSRKAGNKVSESLLAASMASERRLFIEIENQKREKALGAEQKKDTAAAIKRVKDDQDRKMSEICADYLHQCEELKKQQKADQLEQQKKWREYREERQEAQQQLASQQADHSRLLEQNEGLHRYLGRTPE